MIPRTNGRMRLCITLLVLNLAVIWGSSLIPGEISGAISRWVRDVLAAVFGFGSKDPEAGHGLLRKLGHLTEFACLGACLGWLLSMLGRNPWLSLLYGFPVACLDETIQCFTPDRGPSFRDVCIDTAGLFLGSLLLLSGCAIYKNRKLKKSLGGQLK